MKNLDLDELERMREENDARLKELEEVYNRKRENTQVGKIMREKMGFADKKSNQNSPRSRNGDG